MLLDLRGVHPGDKIFHISEKATGTVALFDHLRQFCMHLGDNETTCDAPLTGTRQNSVDTNLVTKKAGSVTMSGPTRTSDTE